KVKICVRRKNNQKIASIAHYTALLRLGIKKITCCVKFLIRNGGVSSTIACGVKFILRNMD
ncbi:hypothetical protein, partial [Salmonella enterica]|uniref:hypothetical protein n=1 Tax=Salmonella enterica TaxID=28901 RepID=UPI0021B48D60